MPSESSGSSLSSEDILSDASSPSEVSDASSASSEEVPSDASSQSSAVSDNSSQSSDVSDQSSASSDESDLSSQSGSESSHSSQSSYSSSSSSHNSSSSSSSSSSLSSQSSASSISSVQSSASSDECGGDQGDLFTYASPKYDYSRTAGQLQADAIGPFGSSTDNTSSTKVALKAKARKNSAGQYIGFICISRQDSRGVICYIAKTQKDYYGRHSGETGDITVNTQSETKVHETGHASIYEAAGKRVNPEYAAKVAAIETLQKATEAEAIQAAKNMEGKLYSDCIKEARRLAEEYNKLHSACITRPYTAADGASRREWRDPNPNWADALIPQIQSAAVNIPDPPQQ